MLDTESGVTLEDGKQRLSKATSHSEIHEIVRTVARKLCNSDGAAFVMKDGEQCFYVDEDAISPLWKGQRFPLTNCISGWSMLNRQSTAISNIFEDPRIPIDAYRPTFVRSLLMVPINIDSPLGAIGVYWADQHLASPGQVMALEELAKMTSQALLRIGIDKAPIDPIPHSPDHPGDIASQDQGAIAHTKLESVVSMEELARDLHDTVLQRLFSAMILLQDSKNYDPSEKLLTKLNTCVEYLNTAIRELRGVIFGLEYGHKVAGKRHNNLLALAAEFTRSSGITPELDIRCNLEAISDDCYFDLVSVAKELLSNTTRHSQASECHLSVYLDGSYLCLEISDNGVGIAQTHEAGNGLRNAKARAESHMGSFEIQTPPTGGVRFLWKASLTL